MDENLVISTVELSKNIGDVSSGFVLETQFYNILLIILAGLFGAIIGAERDIFDRAGAPKQNYLSFGGIRTFSIVAILGGVTVFLDNLIGTHVFVILGVLIVGAFTLVSYIYTSFKKEQLGMTTELAVFLSYFIGIFVVSDQLMFALILTVIVTFILSLKEFFEKIKHKVTRDEINNTLLFAVVTIVVLPLLPDKDYSIVTFFGACFGSSFEMLEKFAPFTIEFFNPYDTWFFVVLMVAISYAGYILQKFVSEESSIVASGAVGGLVSSTAVTVTMSENSKKDTHNTGLYIISTLISSSIMFARVILIVLVFNPQMLLKVSIPAALMLIGMFIYMVFTYIKQKSKKTPVPVPKKQTLVDVISDKFKPKKSEEKKESSFSLKLAVKFALLVVLIKFVSGLGQHYVGDGFNYLLGILAGMADLNAISLTMTDFLKNPDLVTTASITIILAIISNLTVKGVISYRFGEKTFGRGVLGGFITCILCGIVGLVVICLI